MAADCSGCVFTVCVCVCVCVCVYALEWLIEADESLSFRNEIAIFLQLIVEHYQ